MHDHFQRLPPEIVLPIVKQLPDLDSLKNLLRASPTAYRLFDTYGYEIFERVLSSGAIHGYTCGLIRVAVLLRLASLPDHARHLDGFRSLVRHESTSHRYYNSPAQTVPVWPHPPLRLSPDTPATTLRGILATYRKIVCLVISCLRFYMGRFKPLRPLHLLDDNFIFESFYKRKKHIDRAACEQDPPGKLVSVHDIGPPTWVEEQRLLRAFWRVQLFRDLKAAARAKALNWPDEDLQRLHRMSAAVQLHDVPRDNLIERSDAGPQIRGRSTILEHQLIWSVEEYADEDRQTIIGPDFLRTRRDWRNPVQGEEDEQTLENCSSTVYDFFYDLREGENGHVYDGYCSPLQHVSFKPFRRLGFAIWCTKRMREYGLIEYDWGAVSSGRHFFGYNSLYLAWRSVLGEDDIARVVRDNRRALEWFTQPESDDTDSENSNLSVPSCCWEESHLGQPNPV